MVYQEKLLDRSSKIFPQNYDVMVDFLVKILVFGSAKKFFARISCLYNYNCLFLVRLESFENTHALKKWNFKKKEKPWFAVWGLRSVVVGLLNNFDKEPAKSTSDRATFTTMLAKSRWFPKNFRTVKNCFFIFSISDVRVKWVVRHSSSTANFNISHL